MIDVKTMMTPEQLARVSQPKAWENPDRQLGHQPGASPFQMTGHFHTVMKIPTPDSPIQPSVRMRERRLRLVLEEFLELVDAMGFRLFQYESGIFSVEHTEGSRYDLVETADALGDLNVVVNGTAIELGIPMHLIDYEVYCSNLSKLDAEGKPIVNHCRVCGPNEENPYQATCDCEDATGSVDKSDWLKPGALLGKILKPESFVPCNIPAVLVAYQEKEL